MSEAGDILKPDPEALANLKSAFAEVNPKLHSFFNRSDKDQLSDEDSWLVASLSGVIEDKFWVLLPSPPHPSKAIYSVLVTERPVEHPEGYLIAVGINSDGNSAGNVEFVKIVPESGQVEQPISSDDLKFLEIMTKQLNHKVAEIEATIASHRS